MMTIPSNESDLIRLLLGAMMWPDNEKQLSTSVDVGFTPGKLFVRFSDSLADQSSRSHSTSPLNFQNIFRHYLDVDVH